MAEPTDVQLAAMEAAYSHAFGKCFAGDDAFAPCERCNGRGYHHGFGEDGADPDYCASCGGSGTLCTMTEEYAAGVAIRAAWAAGPGPLMAEALIAARALVSAARVAKTREHLLQAAEKSLQEACEAAGLIHDETEEADHG